MVLRIKSSKKIDSNTNRLVNQAFNRCYTFFKFKPKISFSIVICHSNEEFKKESKYYYVPYATALVLRNMDIIIKSPELIHSEGKWKRKDFVDVLSHEMTHSFWYSKLGVWTPNWLSEGIACHIAKHFSLSKLQLKNLLAREYVNFKFIDFRYLPKKLRNHILERYQIWSNFTNYLISIYGKDKILLFLRKYSKNTSKECYEKVFESIYKKKIQKLYEDFVNSI